MSSYKIQLSLVQLTGLAVSQFASLCMRISLEMSSLIEVFKSPIRSRCWESGSHFPFQFSVRIGFGQVSRSFYDSFSP